MGGNAGTRGTMGTRGRLSRAQLQEHNRAKVPAAARDEFAGHGFRDTKIDRIAERAELTRGAVYSDFPGKRTLYFTAERAPEPSHLEAGPREALGVLARALAPPARLAVGQVQRSPAKHRE